MEEGSLAMSAGANATILGQFDRPARCILCILLPFLRFRWLGSRVIMYVHRKLFLLSRPEQFGVAAKSSERSFCSNLFNQSGIQVDSRLEWNLFPKWKLEVRRAWIIRAQGGPEFFGPGSGFGLGLLGAFKIQNLSWGFQKLGPYR
jgi:hypothetical protein